MKHFITPEARYLQLSTDLLATFNSMVLPDSTFMSGLSSQPVLDRFVTQTALRSAHSKAALHIGSTQAQRLGWFHWSFGKLVKITELCGAVFAAFHPGDNNAGVCWQRKSAPFSGMREEGRSNVRWPEDLPNLETP